MQHRRLGRQVDVSHVSMPDRLAITQISDWLAVLDHVGDDVEFRMRLVEWFAVGVWSGRIELSEVLAEGDELRIRETLPVKDDDKPLLPGGFDHVDSGLGQWLRDVDPLYFRSQWSAQIPDRYRHWPSLDALMCVGCHPNSAPVGEEGACSGARVMPHTVSGPTWLTCRNIWRIWP